MDIEQLNPQDGDVLVIIGATNPNETGKIIHETLRRRGCPGNVCIIALPAGMSVQKFTPEEMALIGFVQDTRKEFNCPYCAHAYKAGPLEVPRALEPPPNCPSCFKLLPKRPTSLVDSPPAAVSRRTNGFSRKQRIGE